MFCNSCGTKLPGGVDFCPNCGNNVKELFEETSKASYNASSNESVKMKRLDTLLLSENEEVVKKYHCCSVRRPSCEGYLSVTNKRMLFQAKGNGLFFESRINKEIALDKITGLDCYRGTNISLLQCIIGIVITVISLFNFIKFSNSYFVGIGLKTLMILFIIAGIALIVTSFRKCFKILVYATECSPTPITIGEGAISLRGNSALYAVVSRPTKDTDRMMNELGALVHDMQTMGDLAVSKWKA